MYTLWSNFYFVNNQYSLNNNHSDYIMIALHLMPGKPFVSVDKYFLRYLLRLDPKLDHKDLFLEMMHMGDERFPNTRDRLDTNLVLQYLEPPLIHQIVSNSH